MKPRTEKELLHEAPALVGDDELLDELLGGGKENPKDEEG
jgi:hypothetical protein